jgi:peroxiredoxin
MRFVVVAFLAVLLSFSAFAQEGKKAKPMAEDFTAMSLDGNEFDLSALKGKVILITFWSTKCPICAAEIPKLNELAETYKNKDVVFLGLTTENEKGVKAHLKKKPFNFNILPNSFGILLAYADKDKDGNMTMGYPAHFLINQKGELEVKNSGFGKTKVLAERINQLLSSK